MAININPGSPLRHVATVNSSGNFIAPLNASLAFVSIHGAAGGAGGGGVSRYGGPGGRSESLIAGAFVEVIPGGTSAVVIGAAGTGGASKNGDRYGFGQFGNPGTAGGTTSFDGSLTVTGSSGGSGGQATPGAITTPATVGGSAATGLTSLPTVSPAGALIKTKSISTQQTGASISGNGGAGGRYGSSAGANGVAGIVHIFL